MTISIMFEKLESFIEILLPLTEVTRILYSYFIYYVESCHTVRKKWHFVSVED